MNVSKRQIAAIIFNILIALLGTIGVLMSVITYKTSSLTKFTTESNIIAIIVSVIYVICAVKGRAEGKAAVRLRFMAAANLMVTFLVVLGGCIISPEAIVFAESFLSGSSVFLHLLCPLMSFVSFVFLERSAKLGLNSCFIACIPTFIYGVVSTLLNIAKVWHGPYPFLYVYEQPVYMSVIWYFIINGGAFITAVLIKLIKRYK